MFKATLGGSTTYISLSKMSAVRAIPVLDYSFYSDRYGEKVQLSEMETGKKNLIPGSSRESAGRAAMFEKPSEVEYRVTRKLRRSEESGEIRAECEAVWRSASMGQKSRLITDLDSPNA